MTASRRSLLGSLTLGGAALFRGCAPVPAMADGPDAELIRLCAEFCAIERRIDARFDTVPDDDEREEASWEDREREDELLDRILVLCATTLPGFPARARLLGSTSRNGSSRKTSSGTGAAATSAWPAPWSAT